MTTESAPVDPRTVPSSADQASPSAGRAPAELEGIVFRASPDPKVTVLIPTYGNLQMTARCLRAIGLHAPRAPIEVLVVEDASGDPGMDALGAVTGLRYLSNATNLGFLRSCNAAVEKARGEFVFLLNSDTEVTDGWLDEALAVFETRAGCGMVGTKLVFPDGRLQEAGGIVWTDGTAWNHGREGDAAHPQFNYVREVDYCSGAALLMRRSTFLEAGGFDTRYAPAYYEDTDLAMRLRTRGLATFYCPRAVIIHHEGGSHGTDKDSGVKAFQARNRYRFRDHWRAALEHRHFRNGRHLYRAREHARHRRIVLFVDHTLPQPDRDAGSRAILQTMLQMARMGLLVKFWPDDQRYSPELARVLEDAGIETVIATHWGGDFETYVRDVGDEIDVAIVSRPNFAPPYVRSLRRHSRARVLFFGHDVHHRRLAAQAAVSGRAEDASAAKTMFDTELELWQSVDASIYPSDDEAAHVAAHVGAARVHTVPLYYFPEAELAPSAAPRARDRLLFVACFGHPPNEDAAEWLVREILPRVREAVPSARLDLVGSLPTDRVLALAGPHVNVTGAVSHDLLQAYYRDAAVAITPMRFGAGVKLKVLEAMARGVPLVTTPIGAQGLPGIEACVDVHDDAALLADAVIRRMTDPEIAAERAKQARDYVREHYSADRMEAALWRALTATS